MSALAAMLAIVITLGTVAAPLASAATVDTGAWYVLVNRHSGKVLDIYDLAPNGGTIIAQRTRNDESESSPFAPSNNVSFNGPARTRDFNHWELIRAGNDQTLPLNPCRLQFLYQGLLTQTHSSC